MQTKPVLTKEYVDKLTSLTSLITPQKAKIKELEEIKAKELAALSANDESALIELNEKKEQLSAEVEESKVLIVEESINNIASTQTVVVPEIVYPTVKPKRQQWKVEIADVKKVIQKEIDLLDITLNSAAAKTKLELVKGSGILEGKEEYFENGLRFYLEKTY